MANSTSLQSINTTNNSLPNSQSPLAITPLGLPAEVFIIVRPPPGKNHHPLNLQVQLVLPTLPTSAAAAAGLTLGSSTDVRRTPSVRSGQSSRSNRSLVSFASSEPSRGRRVTPLYNLQWHTVLPTWISDAGTDAKIARFVKKGIEIIDFASIEPEEIRREISTTSQVGPASPIYPASTSSNACSNGSGPIETDLKTGPSSWLKRMKIGLSASKRSSVTRPDPEPDTEEITSSVPNDGAMSSTGPSLGSGRRAEGYVWMVRRWLRPGAPEATVSVEWRKARKPVGTRKSTKTASSDPRRSLTIESLVSPQFSNRRSRHSLVLAEADVPDPNSPPLVRIPTSEELEEDGAEDSEPEDSERPWHCELVVLSCADTNTNEEGGNSRPDRRSYLGSLTPQPHHPRLVGKLSVPWKLEPLFPDDEQQEDGGQRSLGAMLSVEELKDLIVITSMWLIVKEELGGLSGRKGAKSSGTVSGRTNGLVGVKPTPLVLTKPSLGENGNSGLSTTTSSSSGSVLTSAVDQTPIMGRRTFGWPKLGK
ncbi:hypothetical protein CROQUDRAFT_669498 [Cronartium quercuum f. sp. fusiforme G11]|uniref:Uncharacterized protein n=1 Tax=Cronartium quercuum f. sp. fusiforme G11 TaxID=708437 RepID=A0A9P6NRN6_9BASI|nr:hypothetical protein CROQUDRAFT_669498 [Cronartium quercuum f. sp. fusiforme G11]